MAISVRSAKAKGRKLQQTVRDSILDAYPQLEPDDVRSTTMGASGADIQLSPAAKKVFPYSVECKARARMATLYEWYEQASGHTALSPLLVVKADRARPLAVIDLELFMELVQR